MTASRARPYRLRPRSRRPCAAQSAAHGWPPRRG